jgi:hypothetical protein
MPPCHFAGSAVLLTVQSPSAPLGVSFTASIVPITK